MKRKSNFKKEDNNYILSDDTPFQIQEAYKNLRTNVQFSLPAGGCKLIGVTSAERGEGKSTTTVNLAISFAQLGKKVVIIDGDMRLPTVAKKLRMKGTPGLSDYIIGECDLRAVCQVDHEHNLIVVPAGNIPPDPTWLLQSDRMREMVDTFRDKMGLDYVFIDLPPATVVTDAQMLSGMLDGYLLVVQSGNTSERKIAELINALGLVNAKILGFVNTRSNNRGSRYSRSYRKSGYYSYGYGYGDQANKEKKTKWY